MVSIKNLPKIIPGKNGLVDREMLLDIAGRTEKDNANILKYHDPQTDTVIDVKDHPSPIGLVPHGAGKESILLAAILSADVKGYSRMMFRIGGNLGDIIEEESRIYEDGVNIAARLESLTQTGDICISGTVYDQVKQKVPLRFVYLGEQQEYFSDGITNDIITDLSKFRSLMVLAANTVFTYKGKAVRAEEIGRELGVRYVVEGSVQKAGLK
jgi:hypothetical protein